MVLRSQRTRRRTHRPLLILGALFVLVPPALLYAHTRLERSVPESGQLLTEPLDTLRLVFSQGVEASLTGLTLVSPAGDTIRLPRPEPVPGTSDAEYRVRAPSLSEAGVYRMLWRTTAADGHVISGTVEFTLAESATVQEPPPTVEPQPPAMPPPPAAPAGVYDEGSVLSVATRWLLFASLILALGVIGFRLGVLPRTHGAPGTASHVEPALATALAAAAVLLLVALLGRLWLQYGAVFGTAGGFRPAVALGYLRGTGWGRGWVIQAGAGLVLLATALARPRGFGWAAAAMAGLAAALGTALTGHAAAAGNAAVLVDGVHIVAAGTWMGTLAILLLVAAPATWRQPTEGRARRVADLVHAFSPLALGAASIVAISGLLGAIQRLGSVADLWGTDWGRLLVLKVGIVLIAAAAGFFNWRFVRPALGDDDSVRRFRGSAGIELTAGAVILLVTAILVALPTPG